MQKISIVIGIFLILLFTTSQQLKAAETKFILIFEPDYLKVVCKSVNPNLTDENFEVWPPGTNLLEMVASVNQRFGKLPPSQRPIILLPTDSWFFSVYYGAQYPNVNFVHPYKVGNDMPNFFDYFDSIPSNVCLVTAGNKSSDWTWGNAITFIDSSNIQYTDEGNNPIYHYKITSVIKNNDSSTRIYSPGIVNHVKVGWLIYTHIVDIHNQTSVVRSKVIEINNTLGYITINRLLDEVEHFFYGHITVYYLSPVTGIVGAKIKMIMETSNVSFARAVNAGKITGSNQGIRNDSSGNGYLNVNKAIRLISRDPIGPDNFPNPFNPTTTISFMLPTDSWVHLIIYDILGREVETLINKEMMPAGRNNIHFNAENLSSGTYFYKITVDEYIEVKKMMLIK